MTATPETARINYASADQVGPFGTGVTQVDEFIRAADLGTPGPLGRGIDPREHGGGRR